VHAERTGVRLGAGELLQRAVQPPGEAAAVPHAPDAPLVAGADLHVDQAPGSTRGQPQLLQTGEHVGHGGRADPVELRVLLLGQPHLAVAVAVGEVRETVQLGTVQIPERHPRLDAEIAGLPLAAHGPELGLQPAVATDHDGALLAPGAGAGPDLAEAVQDLAGEPVLAPLLDEELEPRPRRTGAEAVLAVHVGERLGHRQHLGLGHEPEQQLRQPGP
jgi:hypothetical protein